MANPPRHIGQYVASGNWSDYWSTRISRAENGRILVRGYPIEELIEGLSFSEAAFLLLRGELPDEREAALFDLALRSGMDQQLINSAARSGASPLRIWSVKATFARARAASCPI